MMIWGFNVSAIKILVSNVDPILLTSFRIFVAGVVVLITFMILGIFRLPRKKEWLHILFIALFNVILHHTFVAIGIDNTYGMNAGLILGTVPLLTMILSILLLRQRVSRWRIFGFILGFIGIIITSSSGFDFASISYGDFIVLLGALVQAFSFILISKLNPSFDPRLFTGYMLFIGSFFIFGTSLFIENDVSQIQKLFSWDIGILFLLSAFFGTAFGHMIYNFAIKQVGPAETAIFINLNTVFAVLGSVLFLGEVVTLNHGIGFLFILMGVFFGTGSVEYIVLKRHEKKNTIDEERVRHSQ